MIRYVARSAGRAEHLGEGFDHITAGLSEHGDGSGRGLTVRCAVEAPDEGDIATGMDSYRVSNERGFTVYGGVRHVRLRGRTLRVNFEPDAARGLGLDDALVEVTLTVDDESIERLKSGLQRVLWYGRQRSRPVVDVDPTRDELTATVRPPEGAAAAFARWDELRARLGVAVPEDYRWLVETYGAGVYDDFLHVLQPRSRFPAIRLVSSAAAYRERLRAQVESGRVLPHDPGDLLPVATTDDGDVISWLMLPRDTPSRWTLVAGNPGRDEWSSFDGGVVEFLVAVFTRRVRMPFFPEDFPSPAPRLRPYPGVAEARALLRELGVAD
ncbi:hypothetical protein Val02_09960 [Virgisporangium aliadipatigenens]|uniref:Knr4/Smi1-like domain-containing protein n=1 Tax=Virgisporangium aliadipatigenens TaxID=741659 RepID=A0A8J4DMT5_9ACTN|nr:Imm10 family immunity protein [Virgisporangium aliadipatigenens]GIJ44110.1 hypothetical protein Val02_09960 [Virgisporangium aliadipatigenens]